MEENYAILVKSFELICHFIYIVPSPSTALYKPNYLSSSDFLTLLKPMKIETIRVNNLFNLTPSLIYELYVYDLTKIYNHK